MSRPFSAFNICGGTRLVSTHMRNDEERRREPTEDELWDRLRAEVLDLDDKTFLEQQEPPTDWAR